MEQKELAKKVRRLSAERKKEVRALRSQMVKHGRKAEAEILRTRATLRKGLKAALAELDRKLKALSKPTGKQSVAALKNRLVGMMRERNVKPTKVVVARASKRKPRGPRGGNTVAGGADARRVPFADVADAALARQILAVARDHPKAVKWQDRVFIASVYDARKWHATLEQFKDRMVALHRKGLVRLTRADLIPAMLEKGVPMSIIDRSAAHYKGAEWHFVALDA